MPIIRVNKNKNYFVASNVPFNDSNLSWEARGVMGYLLSKPDGWVTLKPDLIRQSNAQEYKVTRILSELEKHGYVSRKRERREDGTFYWLTDVYESPKLNQNPTTTQKSHSGSSTTQLSTSGLSTNGSSTRGSSTRGKPQSLVSTDLDSTDLDNTDKDDATDASLDEATATAKQLLIENGLHEPKLSEILAMGHDLDYIERHIGYAKENDTPTGILMRRLLDSDPAPQPKQERGYIPPELEHIIKR